jgi:multisubunit Na+/H+ antiporter MnhF subunit
MFLYILYFLFVIIILSCIFTKNPFFLIIYSNLATAIFIGFLSLLTIEKNSSFLFDSIIIYSIVGFLSTIALTKYFYALKK